jgi:flagellar hook protein FlgE
MSAISSIAQSGLGAASLQLQSSAHNIANLQTPGFRRQQVVQQAQPGGGVNAEVTRAAAPGDDRAADVVGQIEASLVYRANLAVLRTGDRMLGSLVDEHA